MGRRRAGNDTERLAERDAAADGGVFDAEDVPRDRVDTEVREREAGRRAPCERGEQAERAGIAALEGRAGSETAAAAGTDRRRVRGCGGAGGAGERREQADAGRDCGERRPPQVPTDGITIVARPAQPELIVNSLINIVDRISAIGRPTAVAVVIVLLFLAAALLSKVGSLLAKALVDRGERRARDRETDKVAYQSIRQRETAISLVSTTIRYAAFALAFVLSLATLAGAQRLQTVVGASFLAIVVGFAAQRFLTDVIAGLLMFFEGWFRIGDTVAVDAWKAQGVVESVSLRSLTLRSITGEIFHIPNSNVTTLRVIPRGYRDVEVEIFTNALEPGRELVEQIARIVPGGTTRFVRRPRVVDTERLDSELFRITAHCAVAVGREWLAEDLLPSLFAQRAAPGLLVHGPIITFSDEQALQSFSRAMLIGGTPGAAGSKRRRRRRRPRPAAQPPAE